MARLERARSLGTSTQGVFTAASLVAASLLLSRILGLVRVSVFADLFGTRGPMAAYNAAFRVPDVLFTLVAGGALASAFIPVFAGLLERRREAEAWRVANTILNSLLVILVGSAVVAFILAPQITDVLVPGFSSAQKAETASLTRIMLVQPVLLGLGGLFAAMQNSYRRFLLPSIAPVLYNLAIVLGAVIFGQRFGVYAAAWAVVAGAVIMFEVQIWGVAAESRFFRPLIEWQLPEAREVLRLLGPRLVGLSAFQVMLLITTYLASSLTSAAFNAITYAWTLIMFPVGAVGSSVGIAVLPTLSRQSAAAQTQELASTIHRSVTGILFLALPASLGLILLRLPIISLLFAHGAWTATSTDATSFALVFYALAVAPLTMIEVVARAFYALKDTRTPVIIAVGATLLDAVLSIILIRLFSSSRGQGGLALATAIAVWLQVVLLLRALSRRIPGVVHREFWKAVRAIVVATAGMGICVFLLLTGMQAVLPGQGTLTSFVEVAGCLLVGVGAYLFLAQALHLPEVERVSGVLDRLPFRGRTRPARRWDR